MEIPGSSPIDARHKLIKEEFGKWWFFLNSVGIFSFLLFLSSLGTGEDKYFCALLSCLLVVWLIYIGKHNFPKFILHLRRSRNQIDKEFEKELWKEQFPILKVPITHFPYWLGLMSLLSLVIQPLFGGLCLELYIPSYFRFY